MIEIEDVEFFTFFLGVQQSELTRLRNLLDSFPYFKTHKINLIDKSKAVRTLLETGEKKFYDSPRSFVMNWDISLQEGDFNELLNDKKYRINRIVEDEYSFHGESIHKVITEISSKKFVTIFDSDIIFYNSSYLTDILKIVNRTDKTTLAALGMIVQRQIFNLSLHPWLNQNIFDLLMVDNHFSMKDKMKRLIKFFISFMKKPAFPEKLSRFPRLHPMLLTINRDFYLKHNLQFGYMYLDVENLRVKHSTSKHRVFGDNGSSFLTSIAIAGGKVVNIDVANYLTHEMKGSYDEITANLERWNWFSQKLTDDNSSS